MSDQPTLARLSLSGYSTEDVEGSWLLPFPGEPFPLDDLRLRCTLRDPADYSNIVLLVDSEPDASIGRFSIDEQDATAETAVVSVFARKRSGGWPVGAFEAEIILTRDGRTNAIALLSLTILQGSTLTEGP